MSTHLAHITKEHPVVRAASGGSGAVAATWSSAVVGAAAAAAAAPAPPPPLLRRAESIESLEGDAHSGTAFSDSLEEEDSSQSFSDSLKCHRSSVAGGTAESLNSFSDSLEHSGDESDATTTTLDSDSGSFYSVQSYRTVQGGDSATSLTTAEFYSETTLYDSAQSLQTARASSGSSFLILDGPNIENDISLTSKRNSLCFQPGRHPQHSPVEERRQSSSYWEYTSCPDLSPVGYRRTKSLLQSPARLSPLFSSSPASSNSPTSRNSPLLTPLRKKTVTSASMSTVGGAVSPKSGEDRDKKKKGLMPSFRKSRKTSRKLRQQKKAVGENDAAASAASTDTTKTMSDEELMFDSESSAPNSPAVPVKSEVVAKSQNENKSQESLSTLDHHQATHERLNGSASPKGSASGSKTPSPVFPKSPKMDDGVKKFEEKEDKKKEKGKFGSFLSRKDKKQKMDSASKSSLTSNTSAASSVTSDASFVTAADASDTPSVVPSEVSKTGEKKEVKDEIKSPTAAAHLANTGDVAQDPAAAAAADPLDPSFRSYISTVQFVKNYTVHTEIPQETSHTLSRAKVDLQVPKKKVMIDDKTTPEEPPLPSEEVKKKIPASSSAKPSTTEVTSARKTTVTIVSKQKEQPKKIKIPSPTSATDKSSSFVGPTVVASPPSPQESAPPSSSSSSSSSKLTIKPTPNMAARSRSPTHPLPRRLSLENVTVAVPRKPTTAGGQASSGSGDAPPPVTRYKPIPLTVTPPEREGPGSGRQIREVSKGASVVQTASAPAPAPSTPPSSPEGHHGRRQQVRETPEGDRSEGERNQLMESSGLTSGSWVG